MTTAQRKIPRPWLDRHVTPPTKAEMLEEETESPTSVRDTNSMMSAMMIPAPPPSINPVVDMFTKIVQGFCPPHAASSQVPPLAASSSSKQQLMVSNMAAEKEDIIDPPPRVQRWSGNDSFCLVDPSCPSVIYIDPHQSSAAGEEESLPVPPPSIILHHNKVSLHESLKISKHRYRVDASFVLMQAVCSSAIVIYDAWLCF